MDENEALAETPEEKAYFESEGLKPAPELRDEPVVGHEPAAAGQEPPAPKPPEKPAEQSRTVPHQALHEERSRRKEAERRAQEMEQRFSQLIERMGQPQQPPKPDVDTDPVGVVKTHEQELADLRKWREQQEQAAQQQNQYRAFTTRYQASAQEFSRENPDFMNAYQYWVQSVGEELREAGFVENEIAQQLLQIEGNIAAKAFQEDINPAQRIYNIAKRRGYSSKPKAEEQKAEEKIATLQKGANAARSLSAASGNQSPPLTLEALAEMDDDDFDRNWDKVMKQANARR
jgi:hypothetical protein